MPQLVSVTPPPLPPASASDHGDSRSAGASPIPAGYDGMAVVSVKVMPWLTCRGLIPLPFWALHSPCSFCFIRFWSFAALCFFSGSSYSLAEEVEQQRNEEEVQEDKAEEVEQLRNEEVNRKIISKGTCHLLPRTFLVALHERIAMLRWEAVLKVAFVSMPIGCSM